MQKRNYNIDLLRILASFMVIVLHVSAYYWYETPITSFNWKVYNIYDSIVRSAVPIFIMISGAYILKDNGKEDLKKLYFTKILKLLIIYIFWSFIYAMYYSFIAHAIEQNFKTILEYTISGPFHFWFIPTIIILYIISPILKKLVNNANSKIFKYYFIIFMLGCLIKTISELSFLPYNEYFALAMSKFPINIICEFSNYFLLGYFLYNYDISKKNIRISYFLGIASIILCATLTYFLSKNNNVPVTALYNEFSIFTFTEAVALFLFFKNRKITFKENHEKIIYIVSKCTLGIYILHVGIMSYLFEFKINLSNFNVLIAVPVASLLIFVICLIITFIIKQIILIKKLV